MPGSQQKRGNQKSGIKKRPTRTITRDNAMELFEQARQKLVDDAADSGRRFEETPTEETKRVFMKHVTSVMNFDDFVASCAKNKTPGGAKQLVERCAAVLGEEVVQSVRV